MLVGNDVVDLLDPESQPHAIHVRWDSRVFTREELGTLAAASSPHRTRWGLWAAKESAFKVAKKIDPRLSFIPSAFAVDLYDRGSARVQHPVGRLEVRLQETAEYVHAVATLEGSTSPFSRLGRCSATSLAGRQVRDMARIAVGSTLDLDPSQIDISAVRGVPVASSGGVDLPVDLSLSHHGRFLACAWLSSEGDRADRFP